MLNAAIEALNLSSEGQSALRTILEGLAQSLEEAPAADRVALISDARAELAHVLTPAQMATLDGLRDERWRAFQRIL